MFKISIAHTIIAAAAVMAVLFSAVPSGAADMASDTAHAFIRAGNTLSVETDSSVPTLAGGPLRILFIGRHDRIGDIVDGLPDRLDMRFEAVFTESADRLGDPSGALPGMSDTAVAALIDSLLGADWNAVWLDYSLSALPATTRDRLEALVEKGAGMVYVGSRDDLRGFAGRGRVNTERLEAVSFDGMKAEFAGVAGNGRIVSVTPPQSIETLRRRADFFVLASNALIFASGRDTGLHLRNIRLPRRTEFEGIHFLDIRVDIRNVIDSRSVTFRSRFRNADGIVVSEKTDDFVVNEGATFVMLDYPLLTIGEYSLDIEAEGEEGILAFGGGVFEVTTEQRITGIDLWSPYVGEGAIVAGTIRFSTELEEGITMTAELVDNHGRVLRRENLDVISKRRLVTFSFLLKESPGRVLTVRVYCYKSLEHVQTYERMVYVVKPYDPARFSVAADIGTPAAVPDRRGLDALHGNGVSMFAADFSGIAHDDIVHRIRALSAGDARILPLFDNPFYAAASPGSDGGVSSRVTAVADTLRRFGIPSVMSRWPLDDSNTPDGGFFGGDGSGSGQTSSTATSVENLLAFERRLFESHGRLDGIIRKSSPSLDTGAYGFPSGMASVPVFNPYRWKDIAASFVTVPAFDAANGAVPVLNSLSVSFAPPGGIRLYRIGDGIGSGSISSIAAAPWAALFDGLNGVYWPSGVSRAYRPLTPDYRPSPLFAILSAETAVITDGADLMITTSSRSRDDSIGVLYCPLSRTADTIRGVTVESGYAESAASFVAALRDAGYDPVYVTEEMIAGGWPDSQDGVLVLPAVTAMTDNTADIIRRFVARGGAVIADVRPGVLNERFEVRESPLLDDMFGIGGAWNGSGVYETGSLSFGSDWPLPVHGSGFDGIRSDRSVTVSGGGQALASVDGAPAMIAVRHEQGRGLFMNVAVDGYRISRLEGGGAAVRDIAAQTMAFALGEDSVPMRTGVYDADGVRLQAVDTTVFRDGGIIYIGVLPDPRMSYYKNGKAFLKYTEPELPHPVYDVRTGAFAGVVNTVPVDIVPGRALLFAVMPYRVQRMRLTVTDNIVRSGENLEFRAVAGAAEQGVAMGRHVFRIKVFGPDGIERAFFHRTVEAHGGVFAGSLFIARNEENGSWRIRVTDAVSGRSAERTFMVMRSPER